MTDDLRGGNAPLSHEQAGRVGRDTPNAHGPAQRLLSDEELARSLELISEIAATGLADTAEDVRSAIEAHIAALTAQRDRVVVDWYNATKDLADRDAALTRLGDMLDTRAKAALATDERQRARIAELEGQVESARRIAVSLEQELAEHHARDLYYRAGVPPLGEERQQILDRIDAAVAARCSEVVGGTSWRVLHTIAPIKDRALDQLLGFKA